MSNLSGCSVKQLTHYFQLINTGRFRQFDYGLAGNLAHYNRFSPPEYDLRKVTTPVYLHHGENDWVVTPKDAKIVASKLGNLVELRRVNFTAWNHLDFIYGKDADKLINEYIIEKLNEN